MGSVYAVDTQKEMAVGGNEDFFPFNTSARDIIAQARARLANALSVEAMEEGQEPPAAKEMNTGAPITPTQEKTHVQVPPSKGAGPGV